MAVTRAIVVAIETFNNDLCAHVQFYDGTSVVDDAPIEMTDVSLYTSSEVIIPLAIDAILAYCTLHGYTAITAANLIWANAAVSSVISKYSSYQTIVSQTGTAAPAVSGSLAPVSTYPSGTTFAWARTGTGVYTLTASTAVFNTSGKTGVFVAPLQNLNASVRATITSTTVITVTTAVQSVAILGLLGLTATPTDELLSGTMIYVQTY